MRSTPSLLSLVVVDAVVVDVDLLIDVPYPDRVAVHPHLTAMRRILLPAFGLVMAQVPVDPTVSYAI